MGTESTVQGEPRHWLEIEEAPQFTAAAKKSKLVGVKGCSWAVNAMLAAAFVMAVPPLVILLGWRARAPAVWIKTAVAGLRQGNFCSMFARTIGDRV